MGMNDDVLYAEVSILAGGDYLCRYAYAPMDLEIVEKEGWIWVKKLPESA